MKTLTEAIDSRRQRSGVTQDTINSKWGALYREVYNSTDVRDHIVEVLNHIYPNVAVALRLGIHSAATELSDGSLDILNAMLSCYAEGVTIGIEMERTEDGVSI